MQLKDEYISLNKQTRLHNCPMPIVGLTGGIATGKSTVAGLFQKDGFHVINADSLIKEIYKLADTIQFIRERFPKCISKDQIDFRVLRKIAFENIQNKKILENYLYKRMPDQFKLHINSKDSEVVIYDVPLLFEKELNKLVDHNIVVYCPEETQIERLKSRDQIESDLAKRILNNQLPIEDKKLMANDLITNIGTLDELHHSYKSIKEKLFN